MRTDLQKAVDSLAQAIRTMNRIEALPTKIGSRVRWTHNGVVWERTGEDSWIPIHDHTFTVPNPPTPSPSSHVALFPSEEI